MNAPKVHRLQDIRRVDRPSHPAHVLWRAQCTCANWFERSTESGALAALDAHLARTLVHRLDWAEQVGGSFKVECRCGESWTRDRFADAAVALERHVVESSG